MVVSGASSLMNTLRRIGLWFGSVLLSVTLFSQLFALLFNWGRPIIDIFRVTGMFAFPSACLYLPFVIALKGFLTTSSYVIALKVLYRWSTAAKEKFTRP
jgi:hypothetical protein